MQDTQCRVTLALTLKYEILRSRRDDTCRWALQQGADWKVGYRKVYDMGNGIEALLHD